MGSRSSNARDTKASSDDDSGDENPANIVAASLPPTLWAIHCSTTAEMKGRVLHPRFKGGDARLGSTDSEYTECLKREWTAASGLPVDPAALEDLVRLYEVPDPMRRTPDAEMSRGDGTTDCVPAVYFVVVPEQDVAEYVERLGREGSVYLAPLEELLRHVDNVYSALLFRGNDRVTRTIKLESLAWFTPDGWHDGHASAATARSLVHERGDATVEHETADSFVQRVGALYGRYRPKVLCKELNEFCVAMPLRMVVYSDYGHESETWKEAHAGTDMARYGLVFRTYEVWHQTQMGEIQAPVTIGRETSGWMPSQERVDRMGKYMGFSDELSVVLHTRQGLMGDVVHPELLPGPFAGRTEQLRAQWVPESPREFEALLRLFERMDPDWRMPAPDVSCRGGSEARRPVTYFVVVAGKDMVDYVKHTAARDPSEVLYIASLRYLLQYTHRQCKKADADPARFMWFTPDAKSDGLVGAGSLRVTGTRDDVDSYHAQALRMYDAHRPTLLTRGNEFCVAMPIKFAAYEQFSADWSGTAQVTRAYKLAQDMKPKGFVLRSYQAWEDDNMDY